MLPTITKKIFKNLAQIFCRWKNLTGTFDLYLIKNGQDVRFHPDVYIMNSSKLLVFY